MLKFGKQSSLKQKWEISLKSSSLFVRILSGSVNKYFGPEVGGKKLIFN